MSGRRRRTQSHHRLRTERPSTRREGGRGDQKGIARALADVAPAPIQGLSNLVPGQVGTIMDTVGIGAQGIPGGPRPLGSVQQYPQGGVKSTRLRWP